MASRFDSNLGLPLSESRFPFPPLTFFRRGDKWEKTSLLFSSKLKSSYKRSTEWMVKSERVQMTIWRDFVLDEKHSEKSHPQKMNVPKADIWMDSSWRFTGLGKMLKYIQTLWYLVVVLDLMTVFQYPSCPCPTGSSFLSPSPLSSNKWCLHVAWYGFSRILLQSTCHHLLWLAGVYISSYHFEYHSLTFSQRNVSLSLSRSLSPPQTLCYVAQWSISKFKFPLGTKFKPERFIIVAVVSKHRFLWCHFVIVFGSVRMLGEEPVYVS